MDWFLYDRDVRHKSVNSFGREEAVFEKVLIYFEIYYIHAFDSCKI